MPLELPCAFIESEIRMLDTCICIMLDLSFSGMIVRDPFEHETNFAIPMTGMYIQHGLCKVIPINMQRCECQIFVPHLWPLFDVNNDGHMYTLYFQVGRMIIPIERLMREKVREDMRASCCVATAGNNLKKLSDGHLLM